MNEGKHLSENQELMYFLDTHYKVRDKLLALMAKEKRWVCPHCKEKNYFGLTECRRCARKTKSQERKKEMENEGR